MSLQRSLTANADDVRESHDYHPPQHQHGSNNLIGAGVEDECRQNSVECVPLSIECGEKRSDDNKDSYESEGVIGSNVYTDQPRRKLVSTQGKPLLRKWCAFVGDRCRGHAKQREQPFSRGNGFYRVVRCPGLADSTTVNERLRTFVVIEVFQGHQIINNWKCGDLVHYVNTIANGYAINKLCGVHRRCKSAAVLKNTSEDHTAEHTVALEKQTLVDSQEKKVEVVPQTTIIRSDGVTEVHHYHHHYHHYSSRLGSSGNRDPRQISHLTYRDLRQVFTDGSPVPSIEVRRHCIVLCLPPLSCVIMADRVFLLVVEDMCIDELLLRLQRLQEKHLSRENSFVSAVQQRTSKKTRSCFSEQPKHSPQRAADRECNQGDQLDSKNGQASSLSNVPAFEQTGDAHGSDKRSLDTRSAASPSSVVTEFYRSAPQKDPAPLSGSPGNGQDKPVYRLQASGCSGSGRYTSLRSGDQGLMSSISSPIEFETLELLVSAAFLQLERDISYLETRLESIANNPAYRSPTSRGGEELHVLKSHTRLYQDRVLLYDKALDDLMSNSEELVQMELSRLKVEAQSVVSGDEGSEGRHTRASAPAYGRMRYSLNENHGEPSGPNPDLEILLEFFDQEIELLRQRVSRLSEKIDSIERLASFHLALSRNRLLRWDVGSGMVAVAIGAAALITGIFGMNLDSSLEHDAYAFQTVTIVVTGATVVLLIAIYAIIRMTRL